VIRHALVDDLAAITELERMLFAGEAWDREAVASELAGPGRTVLVATDEEAAVVGYAVVMVLGEVADLLRLGVRRDHRRRGLAKALLAEALATARGGGAERLLLEVGVDNEAALAFYRACGFAELDRRPRYFRDGTDALVLGLPL
jgi:ribosomal-protein-alanine N-acetyltransferase